MPHYILFNAPPPQLKVQVIASHLLNKARSQSAKAIINTGISTSLVEEDFARTTLQIRPSTSRDFTQYTSEGLTSGAFEIFSLLVSVQDNLHETFRRLGQFPRSERRVLETTTLDMAAVQRIHGGDRDTKLMLGMDFLQFVNWTYQRDAKLGHWFGLGTPPVEPPWMS